MAEEHDDYYSRQIEEARKWETFYKKVVEELRSEERYLTYFSRFSSESVERFIDDYARQKVCWCRYGDSTKNWQKRKAERCYRLALELFAAIQKKKVFDAIVRWGNYELSVPEARSYYDFNKWLCNPFACPYITPVQKPEVELAIRFIHSLDMEERVKKSEHGSVSLMTLHLIANEVTLDDYDYPLFCRYWDEEHDTAHITEKAPLRIEKEIAYYEAYEHSKEKELADEVDEEPEPQQPSLSYYLDQTIDDFVIACETAELKRMHGLRRWWQKKHAFSDVVREDIEALSGSPRHLPVESREDWRNAIANAAEAYTREQVADCLMLIFTEYAERPGEENPLPDWTPESDYTLNNSWYADYLEEVLAGRRLMNEPGDFNF